MSIQDDCLKVVDLEGEERIDYLTDVHGQRRRLPVGTLSETVTQELFTLIEEDRQTYRRCLVRRPTVVIDGKDLPMDWFQWDRFRSSAWKETKCS